MKLNGNKAVQAKVTLEFTPADAYSKRERGATEEGTDMSRDDDDDDDEEEEEGGSSSSSAAAARKKRLIVTRIAELTSSASGRDSFKTKECTFSDIVGTRSTKWSDTNAPLTKWMGVSKPIIENILLCHQEDSLWPLAEGKKLKEKFDEIFSVTKFSANLDSLREAIKVNKKHIAELNMTKDKYEERKKLVDDKKRSIEAETSSMEASQKAISIITTQQKELSELIQSKEPLRKRLEDEKHKYDFLKGRLNGNNKLVQKYKGKSQLELTATERELQSALDNDDTDKKLLKAKSKAKALQDKKIQYERLRTTVSNASSTLSTEKVKLANAISECIKNECFTFILETHKDLVVKGESNFKLFLEKVKEAEAQLATEIVTHLNALQV